MSVGDYVRHLRAVRGGPTPWDIAESTGVSANTYRQLEQRYRKIGSEEELRKLAEYFEVDATELLDRHDWTRKALSAFLVEAQEQGEPVQLEMRTGVSFTGTVAWSDLGAVLLELDDGEQIVLQRHFIDRWQSLAEPSD